MKTWRYVECGSEAEPDRDGAETLAVRAQKWLECMKRPNDISERREFVRWLKESPLHVREMLSAPTWDHLLDQFLDPERKIDIDAPMPRQGTRVAERAKDWLERMRRSRNPIDRAACLAWLKQSSLHVREMLILTTWGDRPDAALAPEQSAFFDVRIRHGEVGKGGDSASRGVATAETVVAGPGGRQDRRIGWSWLTGLIAAACLAATLALGWWHFTHEHELQQRSDVGAVEQPSGVSPDSSAGDSSKFVDRLEESQQQSAVAIEKDSPANDLRRPGDRSPERYYASVPEPPSAAPPVGPFGVGPRMQFETAVGEQRTIPTADGSVIHLNTQSAVTVSFSGGARDVYLLDGQAFFEVAHDEKRPFRVHIDSSVVQAIGTKFDVHRSKDRTTVSVIEGAVEIVGEMVGLDPVILSGLPARTKLPAGESVTLTADGKMTSPITVDTKEASAWRFRRLVFRNNTLAEIAAEFNRYNRAPKIRVDGEHLRARRYSGIFEANEPELFLRYLAVDHRLVIDRGPKEVIVLASGDHETLSTIGESGYSTKPN